MKKLLLLSIICCIFISSCSMQRMNMREDYYHKYTYQINKNYREVYKDMLENIRGQYILVWIGNQSIIENDLYIDIKYAQIRAFNMNAISGEWSQIQIEVRETKENVSELIFYTSKQGTVWGPQDSVKKIVIEEWVNNL